MAIEVNDSLFNKSPKDNNEKTGIFTGSAWRPFNDISEALTSPKLAYRNRGLTIFILKEGQLTEYWFRDGISDEDLIEKSTITDLSNYYNIPQVDTIIDGVETEIATKQNIINGTGFVKANGTTLSFDNTVYAPINNPTFTGIPKAVTASPGTNTTQLATTAFVIANTPSQNLQSVSTSGNFTDSAIQITDDINLNSALNGLALYTGTSSSSTIAYIKGSVIKSGLVLGETSSTITTPSLTVAATTISLNGDTSTNNINVNGLVSAITGTFTNLNVSAVPSIGNSATNKTYVDNLIATKQNIITLTTTGTSGAATFVSNILNIPNYTTGTGTVTSVGLTVPTGLTITSGSPVTTAGTIAIGLQSGYSIPTITKQTQWDTAFSWGDHSGLYPTLAGIGATGTWSIGITGNAATATSLATTRTIWGQNFNGTANVSGALSGATTGDFSGAISAASIGHSTSSNSLVTFATTGTTISSNKATSDSTLIVNNANVTSTGDIQQWSVSGSPVAKVNMSGIFTATGMVNTLSTNNSSIYLFTTGTQINRNVNDANPTLKVSNTSVPSTGNLAEFYNGSGLMSSIGKFGDIEIYSSSAGVILQSPDLTRWRLTVSNVGVLVITSI